MNLSIWPFKKYPHSKNLKLSSENSPKLVGLGLAGLVAALVGCQYLWEPVRTEPQRTAEPEHKINLSSSVKVFLQTEQQTDVYIGEFNRSSCHSGFPKQWSLFFNSVLGQHKVELDYSDVTAIKNRDLQIRISPQRFMIKVPGQATALEEAHLCEITNDDSVHFAKDSPATREILQPLQALAPDCNFVWKEAKGFSCDLKHPGENEVLASLEALKKNMTTKWNHQPYLLIRRLTLARQLLEAVRKGPGPAEYSKVCRIIQYSLPHELPLSFRSKLWQEKVCHAKEPDREAALLALHNAAQEIQTLSRRIEDASLVGLFTLSVPHDQSLVREYWISLQPIEVPYIVSDQPDQALPCIWHPLFFEQTENLLIAMDLDVIQHSKASTCAAAPGLANAHKEADIYVRSSVASEMEFQIVNGQSKKLRLPTGDYHYDIIQYTGPFPEELITSGDNAPVSSGQISWKDAKPHLIIKNW